MASINFDVNSNSVENKSQVVLRTNPHLTSNVKLVVDSDGELYLDSIDANRVLSNQRYKKFPLDSTSNYAYDLAQFYKNTPLDKAYEVWNRDSNMSVFRDYNKQYEEQYQYGSRLNDSKLYEDNIRFFAPIWLDTDLPEYFVIYRINEPVSQIGLTDTYDGINGRVMQMLNNAVLIKTFDLRQGSKLGNYLNNYINDPKFPSSPLTVSFEKDEKTSWNGIDLVKGGFTSKGEYIFEDFAVTDRQEILNNQYISEGFKRNTMVCANLLNLEFIFDDPTARPYDVHRYVGFYVKAHVEGKFKAGSIRKGILKVLASTVETEYDLTGTSLTPISMLPNDDLGLPVLQWVRNRGVFYNVLNTSTGSLELKVAGMSDDTEVTGKIQKPETLQVEGAVPALKDFIKLNVIDTPLNGERWVVANKGEWNTIGDENYFTITADGSIPAGEVQGQRFSNQGTPQQIANSILQAINNIQDNPLRVTRNGSSLIIEHNSIGNRLYRSFFGSHSTNALDPFEIEVGEFDNVTKKLGLDNSVYTDWNVYYPTGGSNSGIGFLISETEVGDIDTNTYIKVKTGDFYKIIDIVKDPYYSNLYRVCLSASKTRPELLFDTSFNLYVDSYVDWGKFEMFDFVDFDFNFNSTDNNDPKELQYEDYDTQIQPVHFSDSLNYTAANYSSYFKQLEGINNAVTAFGSGVVNINSEYDRLKENYLTSTSTLSRVVPTINKWVYKDSVNSKDKPYFLSTSESFGKTNFSPDITVTGRVPQSMTHEWFYLYKYPQYTSVPQTQAGMGNVIRSFYSYLQPDETINLTASNLQDVNDNWFDRLFMYEGIQINGDWVPTVPSKKWSSIIKGTSISPAETMFRGLKVKFYSRKEFTETNPRNLLTNSDFNGYKFSAVLNYNGQQSTDSISYKVIQNKKWKTVTFYVEINSSDELLTYVNRKMMYEVNHFITASPAAYVASNVSGYLDWETAQTVGTNTTVYGEGTFFNREIQVGPSGGYGEIQFVYSGYTFNLQVVDILGDNLLVIETDSLGNVMDQSNSIQLSLASIVTSPSITYKYLQGGYNLATSTFEAAGINYISDLVNLNDTEKIEYITVEEDGSILPNRFIINIEDGNAFTKQSKLRVEADPNKPKSYKVSSGLVGYINTELSTPVNANLLRMGGDYSPLMRKVVWFTDIYKDHKLNQTLSTTNEERQRLVYNKFNRLGIAFASYVNLGADSYGLIKDYYFHKVNPDKADGILKLSQSGDGSPVYPLINEVAIDKRDFNVFRSSWEDGFYVNNDTQSSRQFVFGTLSAHEESSFLASTLNLPRDSYNLTSFNAIRRGNAFEELQNIKRLNNYNGDVVMWEDSSNVWIDLYLKNRVTEILTVDGAGRSLLKYVDVAQSYGDKNTLDDDIKEYIEVNLLKLLGVEQVRLWNNPSKTINQSELLSADSLQQILDTNIPEEKSFRVEYDPNHPLNVRLIYNKRPGFRHQFYVYVKISS